MNTEAKNMPLRGMDLNEKDEWVEVPLENVLPKWLDEAISDEDEDDTGVACVLPYLQDKFHQWLMDVRGINAKSADDYIRQYESAYDHLYEEVGIDLYDLLQTIFEENGDETGYALTEEDAPDFVKIYLDKMLEKMDEQEDSFTKAELRALASYHAFIVDLAGTEDETFIKEKSTPLPDEREFTDWLEAEYKMDYENARKIASSIKRMDLILPSLVTEPMTFLEVLRAIPINSKRTHYVERVANQKQRIYKNAKVSYKTVQTGLANIIFYLNFLNNK